MLAALGATLVLFVWGRWRYDLVAIGCLLVLTFAGIVPAEEAFLGFGHPAVITVAAVLVIGRALTSAGFVSVVAGWLVRLSGPRPAIQIPALTLLVAVLSSFVNNVGALALMLPVALRMARESDRPGSAYLMPLAFGSLFGGLVTLIGTPPNIIISGFRGDALAEPFRMFDFAPVGAGVAILGVALISLVGWRVIPEREGSRADGDLFEIESYVSEVRLPRDSEWSGRSLGELREDIGGRLTVIGLSREGQPVHLPSVGDRLHGGDLLVVEAEPDELEELVRAGDLEPEVSEEMRERILESDDFTMVEAVVRPDSRMIGRTARGLNLRSRHGVNLLGVAREGHRVQGRLPEIELRAGDLLLLQGGEEALRESLRALGGLAIRERETSIRRPRRLLLAVALFAAALAAMVGGLLEAHVALMAAAAALIAFGILPVRDVYDAVDWPVIVLLAAMLPVGDALESTGAAASIAQLALSAGEQLSFTLTVALVLTSTMLLSNVINNAAAAVLMAPVALSLAAGLDVGPDPFLMATAVGASCAFLTPIGHQSNTLVMGPGGYRFSDYLYLGIPVSILVAVVAPPLIVRVWGG